MVTLKALVGSVLFLFLPIYGTAAESSLEISPQTLIMLTNEERKNTNLPPLSENPVLASAANLKASDIMERDYFAHTTPDNKPFYSWIVDEGYSYRSAGENLAISFTNNEDIIRAWILSQTHRANILDPNYNEIGIAVLTGEFEGEETTIVVQLFGESLSQLATEKTNDAQILGIRNYKALDYKPTTSPWIQRLNFSLSIGIYITAFIFGMILLQRLYKRSSIHIRWNW